MGGLLINGVFFLWEVFPYESSGPLKIDSVFIAGMSLQEVFNYGGVCPNYG